MGWFKKKVKLSNSKNPTRFFDEDPVQKKIETDSGHRGRIPGFRLTERE
jgi:hypothetical protein